MAQPELKAPLKAGLTWPDCVSGSGFPNGMHLHLVAYPMMMIVVVCVCWCSSAEGNGGGYGGESAFVMAFPVRCRALDVSSRDYRGPLMNIPAHHGVRGHR
jgi:hypothetical protein